MGFLAFMTTTLHGKLSWDAAMVTCEIPETYDNFPISKKFKRQWETLVGYINEDRDRVSEEMKVIQKGHDKSDKNAFFFYTTAMYYVYSFGYHFTPSGTTISEWQNCLSYTSMKLKTHAMLRQPALTQILTMNTCCHFWGQQIHRKIYHVKPDLYDKRGLLHCEKSSKKGEAS